MSIFDWIFLGLLFVSTLLGLWRGLVSECFALVSWLCAFTLAWQGAPLLGPLLASVATADWLQWMLAFVVIVVLVLILLALLRFLIREMLAASGLGPVDRLLGGTFGLLRGMLIALVVVALAGGTAIPQQSWWRESLCAESLQGAVKVLKPWLPDILAERLKY